MGYEVKRVHKYFRWPLGELWDGYLLENVLCPICDHFGKDESCPLCSGYGKVDPFVEPPKGYGDDSWWQMWEDCSSGSPISPPCETPEALAEWLAANSPRILGDIMATKEQWLSTIKRGWAPTAVYGPNGPVSGVEGLHDACDTQERGADET